MKRDARPGRCHCGTPIWRGPDDDWAAIVVAVDAAPIRATAEAWALLGGWDTFDLIDGRIVHRDPWRIAGSGATVDVYVEHRCDVDIPQSWLQTMTPHKSAAVKEESNVVPF